MLRLLSCLILGIGLLASIAASATATRAQQAAMPRHLPLGEAVPPPEGAVDLCNRFSWACARSSNRDGRLDDMLMMAHRVNRDVNRSVRPISDLKQYGREELWALPTPRGGDCEDYALRKKQILYASGVDPARLLLATVLDTNMSPHAVLVLRHETGDFVLDNLNNKLLGWAKTGYIFMRVQNPRAPHGWNMVLRGGVLDDGPTSSITKCVQPY
ncbi:transglutaminase-like cysteine peptidase [Rhodovulum sp. YNF3179]